MFIIKSDRKNFLDFIQNRNLDILISEDSKNILLDLYGDEILLIWSQKPRYDTYLPECICVSKGKTKEFLAWALTYLRTSFFPFTSYCRIVEIDLLKQIRDTKIKLVNKELESILLGAIIGETISLFEQNEIKSLSITAAKSTYSYALARSIILGLPISNLLIKESYKMLHSIYDTRSNYLLNTLDEVWQILFLLLDRKYSLESKYITYQKLPLLMVDSLMDIMLDGKISSSNLSLLIRQISINANINLNQIDHRESRFVEFEKFINSLVVNKENGSIYADFVCAYLVNSIGPGTFSHNNIIKQYKDLFPSIYIWYAVIAGISPNSELLRYNNGYGYRIMKDLYQADSILQRPQADISIKELEMITGSDSINLFFTITNQPYISVEIAPSVNSIVASPVVKGLNSDDKNQVLFDELGLVLNNAFVLYEKLADKKTKLQYNYINKSKDGQNKPKNTQNKK